MKIAAEMNTNDIIEFENSPFTGYCYAKMGEYEKAREVIRANEQTTRNNKNLFTAMVYAGLNETDRVFEYLEKSLDKREFSIRLVKSNFKFDSIRSDPRYKPLIRKIFEESIQKVDIPEMRTPVYVDPDIFDAYIGRYYWEHRDENIIVKKEQDRLYLETARKQIFRLYPLSETEFFSKQSPDI